MKESLYNSFEDQAHKDHVTGVPEPMLTNPQWDIHLRAISQEKIKILIDDMGWV